MKKIIILFVLFISLYGCYSGSSSNDDEAIYWIKQAKHPITVKRDILYISGKSDYVFVDSEGFCYYTGKCSLIIKDTIIK